MYTGGVMEASRFHADRAAPKPEGLGGIVKAIKNLEQGEACHCMLPIDIFPGDMVRQGGIVMPEGARPPAALAAGKRERFLWITGGNVTSGLHFDQDYNSLTVLQGTKRVFMFAPEDTPNLYLSSTYVQSSQASQALADAA